VIALSVAVATACGGSATTALPVQTQPSPKAVLKGGPPAHLAVVVLENLEYGQVIGSSSAPYVNGLAERNALATRSFAISHPSLPNYLALTGGSTFGIESDCTDCSVAGSGLAGQLDGKGLSWKAYMENLPHPCFKGSDAGAYVKRHDPFVYYRALVENKADCNRVVPLTQLRTDAQAHDLPRFIWITPNICHDAHDCPISTADHFLKGVLPSLLGQLGPNGLLFLTFDEGTSDDACCKLAAGGHVVTIVAGQGARQHARLDTPVDHYSLLQTIEDLFGLTRLRGADCICTPSLAPLLKGG
jgi:acid phosphatase